MSFVRPGAVAAYARVGVESGVESADPHRLILMLFEGALVAIGRARAAMLARDPRTKGECVSRAIQIVEQGLKASLDEAAGGELTRQLRSLYDYVAGRMLIASASNDPAGLDEAAQLLGQLKDAWEAMPAAAQLRSSAPSAVTRPAAAR
ncbi:MAG: flagellar export chaperone FliS [Burkholderiales bacterium]